MKGPQETFHVFQAYSRIQANGPDLQPPKRRFGSSVDRRPKRLFLTKPFHTRWRTCEHMNSYQARFRKSLDFVPTNLLFTRGSSTVWGFFFFLKRSFSVFTCAHNG